MQIYLDTISFATQRQIFLGDFAVADRPIDNPKGYRFALLRKSEFIYKNRDCSYQQSLRSKTL